MINAPIKYNGEARYAYRMSWQQRDLEGERITPASVTAKLVRTTLHRFDRFTGRCLDAFNPSIKPRRLVAYRVAGGDWVTVADPQQREAGQ